MIVIRRLEPDKFPAEKLAAGLETSSGNRALTRCPFTATNTEDPVSSLSASGKKRRQDEDQQTARGSRTILAIEANKQALASSRVKPSRL
jgi:hypothetical protein